MYCKIWVSYVNKMWFTHKGSDGGWFVYGYNHRMLRIGVDTHNTDENPTYNKDVIELRSEDSTGIGNIGHTWLAPVEKGVVDLGYTAGEWRDIYCVNGTIVVSDRNKKDNIRELDDRYIELFRFLIPVSYTFKDGTSGRTHVGFIAQDIEDAIGKVGLTALDFVGFCKDVIREPVTKVSTDEDGNDIHKSELISILDNDGNEQYSYSLRYDEFIAIITKVVQDHDKKMERIEEKLKEQDEIISSLKAEMERLRSAVSAV